MTGAVKAPLTDLAKETGAESGLIDQSPVNDLDRHWASAR
jgi:hypothetical protein